MSEEGEIRAALRDAYTEEGVETWMHSRNRNLDGRTPFGLLVAGEGARVLEEAQRLSDDAS